MVKLRICAYQQCGHSHSPVPWECLPDEEFERLIDTMSLAVRRITNGLLPLMGQGIQNCQYKFRFRAFQLTFTGAYCISNMHWKNDRCVQEGIDVVWH